MGCGIYFPPDYDSEAEFNSNDEEEDYVPDEDDDKQGKMERLLGILDSDDEEYLVKFPLLRSQKGRMGTQSKGMKVTVSNFTLV